MSSSWVDIDWSDNHVPTEDEIQRSLRPLQFRPVPIEDGAVIRLVDTFSTMLTNGGAYAATFDVVDSDDVAACLISRNRDEYTLANTLVRSAAFAEAMAEVAGMGPLDLTDFERSSALTLDGDLARKLQWGGAYTHPSMPGAQAKALGAAFCADLVGDRYDDVDVDHSWGAVVSLVQRHRLGCDLGRHRQTTPTRHGAMPHRHRLDKNQSPSVSQEGS